MGLLGGFMDRLMHGGKKSWMYYDSYGNDWERLDTHHGYTIEERGEDYVIIDMYQIHEYFHSGKTETQLAGFKTGSQKIEDPGEVDGEIGEKFNLYIMGTVPKEYVPLDSFDREVTIT